eukprot:5597162-Alexandrium_andersonii.AAC.1
MTTALSRAYVAHHAPEHHVAPRSDELRWRTTLLSIASTKSNLDSAPMQASGSMPPDFTRDLKASVVNHVPEHSVGDHAPTSICGDHAP